MRKRIVILGILTCSLVGNVTCVKAQSLKDILNSSKVKDAVNALTGNVIKFADLQGNWDYVQPACKMTSEDLLKEAGGSLVSSSLEKKMVALYTKLGIVPGKFTYTFNGDSTFVNTIGKKKLKGTYSLNEKARVVTLNYSLANTITIKKMDVQLVKSEDQISLLFSTEKLMNFLNLLSSALKKTEASTASSLMDGFDGILLGFDMKK